MLAKSNDVLATPVASPPERTGHKKEVTRAVACTAYRQGESPAGGHFAHTIPSPPGGPTGFAAPSLDRAVQWSALFVNMNAPGANDTVPMRAPLTRHSKSSSA